MPMEPDYYEILHVSAGADRRAIVAAYRRLARKYHPDLSSDAVATERMRDLNDAVEILADAQKRAEYDARRAKLPRQEAPAEPESLHPTLYREGDVPSAALRTRRPKKSRTALVPIGGAAGILLGLLTVLAIQLASDAGKDQESVTGPDATTVPGSPVLSATPAAAGLSATPASPPVTPPVVGSGTFSNGTWLVGEEIAPGVWRAFRPTTCSWKRLASVGGVAEDVAGSGSYLTVEIRPFDAAFSSDDCGWWSQILTPPSASPFDPFGPGTWLVNEEIAPGLWQNSDASEGCSWARLNKLDGEPSAITASGATDSLLTVEIVEADLAFDSTGCGTWTRIGP